MKSGFALSLVSSLALCTLVGCGSAPTVTEAAGAEGIPADGNAATGSDETNGAGSCTPIVPGEFTPPVHATRQHGSCNSAELDLLGQACADPESSDCIDAIKDGAVSEDCAVCALTDEDTQLDGNAPPGAILSDPGFHRYVNQGGCVGLQDPTCEDQATLLTECVERSCSSCEDSSCPANAADTVCSSYALDTKCTQSIAAEKFPSCFPSASTPAATFVRGVLALFCG